MGEPAQEHHPLTTMKCLGLRLGLAAHPGRKHETGGAGAQALHGLALFVVAEIEHPIHHIKNALLTAAHALDCLGADGLGVDGALPLHA